MPKLTGPTAPHIVAVDVGNASTTAVVSGAVAAHFPSFVARFGVGSYAGDAVLRRDGGHITWDGQHAFIGCDALRIAGYDSLLAALPEGDAHQRYTAPASIMTLLAAIGSAIPEPEYLSIALGTGVPKSVEPHAASIGKALTGRYDFVHHGRPRRIDIVTCQVFVEASQVHRLLTPAQRAGDVAIHDLGGRTYGVHGVSDGAYRGGRSYPLGMDVILDGISGISTDPGARLETLRALAANPKHDPALRRQIVAGLRDAIKVAAVKSPLARVRSHVVIGGAAWALAEALRAEYSGADVVVPDYAAAANALSYAAAMEAK